MSKTYITLPISKIEKTCQLILRNLGTPQPIATRVVQSLLDNELRGYPSHGVLRMLEIVAQIRKKSEFYQSATDLKEARTFSNLIISHQGE